MLVFRAVVSVLVSFSEDFLYELKAGPTAGRLRRPSSRRQRPDAAELTQSDSTEAPERALSAFPPTSPKCILPFPYQRSRLPQSGLGQRPLHRKGGAFLPRRRHLKALRRRHTMPKPRRLPILTALALVAFRL